MSETDEVRDDPERCVPLPSEGETASLLAQSADLFAVCDMDGKLQYLNPAGRRLLGLAAGVDERTVSMRDHLAEPSALDDPILVHLAEHGWWADKLTIVTAAGSTVQTSSNMRTVARSDGGGPTITWIARDRSTEDAIIKRLKTVAFNDELTGLVSPRMLRERIYMRLEAAPGESVRMGLCFVSLDRFTAKNDRWGQDAGDELLRQVGQRLASVAETPDSAGRWVGDQFVLVFEDRVAVADPVALGQHVLQAFDRPFTLDDNAVYLSASVGVATTHSGVLTTDQLLRDAEAAAQMAKQNGGGRVQQFDEEMLARARRRSAIEDALRGATDRGEIELHYQPIVSLLDGSITSVEGLARWHHPGWGTVSPAEFIPVAEDTGLILGLGEFVLREGMAQSARWNEAFGTAAPSVSINISPRQFVQEDFVAMVARTLAETGAEPSRICLEITESVLMHDLDATVAVLWDLKSLGVQLAVDDFGTGYSSLTYLRAFPVDILKVDQSFVAGLGRDREASAIVEAVVGVGRALELKTVAEGVETAHHVIELLELECVLAQGFYYARPTPAEVVTRLLAAGPRWQELT